MLIGQIGIFLHIVPILLGLLLASSALKILAAGVITPHLPIHHLRIANIRGIFYGTTQ